MTVSHSSTLFYFPLQTKQIAICAKIFIIQIWYGQCLCYCYCLHRELWVVTFPLINRQTSSIFRNFADFFHQIAQLCLFLTTLSLESRTTTFCLVFLSFGFSTSNKSKMLSIFFLPFFLFLFDNKICQVDLWPWFNFIKFVYAPKRKIFLFQMKN